ncbi:hypothetical protein [Ruegeria arenilitoris]|uniref:hypothetical protein n=1 Tax=Ruegeria arenilitoris TaxID=1173585 RepID=UPI00147D24B7|nr:hypothetical protein [Ruegeria arenilitoris]
MGLAYDFDIVTIAKDGGDCGSSAKTEPKTVTVCARFRDVKTADALRGASPKLRQVFVDAGFILDSHGSGESRGFYPPEDAAAREKILRQLFANIRATGLRGQYCGEFDLRDFLRHVRSAQPGIGIKRRDPVRRPQPATPAPAKPDRRTVPGRIGFALGLAVIVFVLLKYLAAAGATP